MGSAMEKYSPTNDLSSLSYPIFIHIWDFPLRGDADFPPGGIVILLMTAI